MQKLNGSIIKRHWFRPRNLRPFPCRKTPHLQVTHASDLASGTGHQSRPGTPLGHPTSLTGSLARSLAKRCRPWTSAHVPQALRHWRGRGLCFLQLSLEEVGGGAGAGGRGQGDIVVRRTVCSHCSVGCAVDAVVQNGVWVRQEPVFDSPIAWARTAPKELPRCASEHGRSEYRLKTPMKLVDGAACQLAQAPTRSSPDEPSAKPAQIQCFFVGSSKHNNEQAYLRASGCRSSAPQQTPDRICPQHPLAGIQHIGAMAR